MRTDLRWGQVCLVLLAHSGPVVASAEVGSVYHPYIEPREREIELHTSVIDDSGNGKHKDQKNWLACG